MGPADVSDACVERFAWELNNTSFRGRPTAIVRGAIRGWNDAVDAVPGWPQHRLTLAERNREGYVLSADKFPVSFQQSLTGYLAYLADPPRNDARSGIAPDDPQAAGIQFRQMARHWCIGPANGDRDHQALDGITSIRSATLQRAAARWRPAQRSGDRSSRILRPIALYTSRTGPRPTGSPGVCGAWAVAGHADGMTEKNRRRLSVFRDPSRPGPAAAALQAAEAC